MKNLKITPKNYIPEKDAVLLDIEFPHGDLKIKGSVYLPMKARAAMVFCHGLGQSHDKTIPIEDVLPDYMAVVKITQTGHENVGGNFDPVINEESTHYILDRLYEICHTDKAFVGAHSAGCHPAMGAGRRDDVLGLILMSPPNKLYYTIIGKKVGRRLTNFFAQHFDWINDYAGKRLEKGWESKATNEKRRMIVSDFRQSVNNIVAAPKLVQYASEVSCPVLIFQGLKDRIVRYKEALLLKEALDSNNVPVEMVRLDKTAHHPFKDEADVAVIEKECGKWINRIVDSDEANRKLHERAYDRWVREPKERRRRFRYVRQLRTESHPYGFLLE